MAIEYSLNKIKNFFVGKDILGRDAIVHSRVTFLMKRVPKEMADATRAGYLSHASCFVNLPYPAIGDWDDQIPPIIRVEEFTLTEEGREQLDELYDVNLVQADKDDTLDTWQSQWEEEAGSICSSLCDTLMESINVSGENVALLNTCKQYFTSHEFGNLEGKNLSIALLLSYVIEYIAREKFLFQGGILYSMGLTMLTSDILVTAITIVLAVCAILSLAAMIRSMVANKKNKKLIHNIIADVEGSKEAEKTATPAPVQVQEEAKKEPVPAVPDTSSDDDEPEEANGESIPEVVTNACLPYPFAVSTKSSTLFTASRNDASL